MTRSRSSHEADHPGACHGAGLGCSRRASFRHARRPPSRLSIWSPTFSAMALTSEGVTGSARYGAEREPLQSAARATLHLRWPTSDEPPPTSTTTIGWAPRPRRPRRRGNAADASAFSLGNFNRAAEEHSPSSTAMAAPFVTLRKLAVAVTPSRRRSELSLRVVRQGVLEPEDTGWCELHPGGSDRSA